MKKYIIFLIFINFTVNAQDISFSINYKAYPTFGSIEKDKDFQKSKMSFIYNGIDDEISKLNYTLDISNNYSHFYLVNKVYENERTFTLAKSFAGSEDFFSENKTNSKIKVKDFLGKIFYIKDTTNYVWKIENETKYIDSVLCYKATTNKKIILKSRIKEHTVIAWFAPSISTNFGPKGFNGLPGLILELTDDKITLSATSIKNVILNEKDVIFNKNNKLTTQEQFDVIVNEKYEEFFPKND